MDDPAKRHPSDQTLSSFGLGKLDAAAAALVQQHLVICAECRGRVAEVTSDSSLNRLRGAGVRPDSPPPVVPSLVGFSQMGTDAGAFEPPAASTLPPGLADHPDYEILRELGRGGMGVVYLAQNKLMGRKEVLKVVGGHLVDRPAVLERFLREIRSAAMLHHTNIVTAYSAFRAGESIVFAMEYVEGYDLAQLVTGQGPLAVAHACNFLYQAALGLQYAHEKGMVHRDIKPSNLIMAREGKKPVVKVLNFGLAKVTSEGQRDSGLTREGQMLGTPDFIAPEQIRDAQSADIRADVYSLGCTLYYLLAGRPPFAGDNLWDLYQAHFSMDAGPLNFVRPEVPVELAAVVAKMMAKEPNKRFQTPGEVAQSLTAFFKPAASRPSGSRDEVSRINEPAPATQASAATPAPAKQATPHTVPDPAVPKSPKMGAEGVAWESLIEIKDDESLIDKAKLNPPTTKPAQAEVPVRRPPWLRTAIAAAALFGVIALGIIVIIVEGRNGRTTTIIVPDDKSVQIKIQDDVDKHAHTNEDPTPLDRTKTPKAPPADNPGTPLAIKPLPESTTAVRMPLHVESIDLFSLIDVRRDTTRGQWQRLNSSLLSVPDQLDVLRIPYKPPAEYRLEIVAEPRPLLGHNDLQIGVMYGKSQCVIVLDGWGGEASGISWVEGHYANNNETTFRGRVFKDTGPTHVSVTVHKHKIRVTANERSIIDWVGDESRLSLLGDVGAERGDLYLAVQKGGGYRVDAVTLIPLSEPGKDESAKVPGTLDSSTEKPSETTNATGMKLVLIPPGEFLMGTTKDQVEMLMKHFPDANREWFAREQPQHRVRITRPFLLGAHEVTQGQYQVVMGENPSKYKGSDDLPVEQVSWLDAVNFCNKLSERDGRRPFYRIQGTEVTVTDGDGYRLPTEAEWEYACRAGTSTLYPFGDSDRKLGEYAWHIANAELKTHPVGQKRPNAWGLHDMLGNVWEWCSDWCDGQYYASSPTADPPGPARAWGRVRRGWGWDNFQVNCRPAGRGVSAQDGRFGFIGFRVAAGPTPGKLFAQRERWTFLSYEIDGKRTPDDELKQGYVITDGNRFVAMKGDKITQAGTMKLDPTKTPKEVDLIISEGFRKGVTMLGIYEQDGNTTRFCVDRQGKTRPTEFRTEPGSGRFLAVYLRTQSRDNESMELGGKVSEFDEPGGPSGFVRLFNGKDLEGWYVDSGLESSWRVEHGELVATGSGDYRKAGFLLTKRDYGEFRLRFEFRASRNTNSGLAFRALPGERFEGIPHHLQIELFDSDKPDMKNGAFGWESSWKDGQNLSPGRPVEVKPTSEWNNLEAEVRRDLLRLVVNGSEVLCADLGRLAKTPGAHPGLKRLSGRIGLQSHTGTIWFRNIEIKEFGGEQQSKKRGARQSRPRHHADAHAFRGKFYKVFPQHVSWHEAELECRRQGGHLAMVKNEHEDQFLTSLMKNCAISVVWLGATDEQAEGQWKWVDGEPLQYNNWNPGQPNNKQNIEHFAIKIAGNSDAIRRGARDGNWHDQPNVPVQCSPAFICQWD